MERSNISFREYSGIVIKKAAERESEAMTDAKYVIQFGLGGMMF
jgi:hypothetical protein